MVSRRGPERGPGPTNPSLTAPRPDQRPTGPKPVRPIPVIELDTIRGDIDRAGAGVKLVKTDLVSGELVMTMDLPEGVKVKESLGDFVVTWGRNFSLKIALGRADFAFQKRMLADGKYSSTPRTQCSAKSTCSSGGSAISPGSG